MAELYVGTPNGVQKLGNECTYPIPKGNVLINGGIVGNTTYNSGIIDALKNKTFIEIVFSNNNNASYGNGSGTIRVLANTGNSRNTSNGGISSFYDAVSGSILLKTAGNVSETFRVNAYYYE